MKSFLKKMRSELLEEKVKLEAERSNIRNRINRNEKFLQKLKEEEDLTYDVFSPRRKNVQLQEHIRSLKEEQKKLFQSSDIIEKDIVQLDSRLEEVDQVIKTAKKEEFSAVVEEPKKQNNMVSGDQDPLIAFLNKNIRGLLQKTDLCFRILKVDPNRCMMELSIVKKTLQDIQELLADKEDLDGCN